MGPDAVEFGLKGGDPFTEHSGAMTLRHDIQCAPEQCDPEGRGDRPAKVERAMEGVVREQQDGESRCDHPPSDLVWHSPGGALRAARRVSGPRQHALPDLRRATWFHGPGWREVERGQQGILHPRERTCALLALPEVDEERCPLSPGQQGKAGLELSVLSIKRNHSAPYLRMDNFSLSF
ncbi:MAG: hypothetical protein AB1941_06195 [Gemmatimonadota bacterium]